MRYFLTGLAGDGTPPGGSSPGTPAGGTNPSGGSTSPPGIESTKRDRDLRSPPAPKPEDDLKRGQFGQGAAASAFTNPGWGQCNCNCRDDRGRAVVTPPVPFSRVHGTPARGGGYTDPGRDAGGATGPRADPFGRGGSRPQGSPKTPGGPTPGGPSGGPLSGGYFFTRPNATGCWR